MPTLPNKPKAGSSLKEANLPDVIGKLIDYCRSITPRSSPSVKCFTGSAGTTFTAQRTRPGRSYAAESSYESFFRVVDASVILENGTRGDCRVGVTSGSSAYSDSGNCGVVKVNGIRVSTPVNIQTLTEDGEYHVWIHSWVDALSDGHSEIIFGDVDDDAAPNNPNGGILYASQLAGRAVVLDGRVSIVQDYLHGGEHIEWIFAPCDYEVIDP